MCKQKQKVYFQKHFCAQLTEEISFDNMIYKFVQLINL